MWEALFSDNAAWFAVPALLGTLAFVIRMALAVLGGHIDMGDIDAHHGDPGEAFKLLSIQTVIGFLMGFGWGGLAAMHGTDWGWPAVMLTAVAAGAATVWLLTVLLKGIHDLQASGNIDISQTIGAEGDVYVSVPRAAEGRGQVRLVVDNRQRIFNAVSQDEVLPTNTRVRVVQVNHDNTLTVARA